MIGYWIFVDKERLLLCFRGFQNSFRDSLIVSSREIDKEVYDYYYRNLLKISNKVTLINYLLKRLCIIIFPLPLLLRFDKYIEVTLLLIRI